MEQKITFYGVGIILLSLMAACLPDRMAPVPTDVTRPEFLGFAAADSGSINVTLRHPVTMIFDEKMDLATFPDHFRLSSISGEIGGTFSIAENADSVVIFTPAADMQPAEVYTTYVMGGVRDVYGNSRLSPNDDNIPETTHFFVTGAYARNGFAHVFVADKLGEIIFQVGEINKYQKQGVLTQASREMRMTPDGTKLLVTNKVNPGILNVIDPSTMTEITSIAVGSGPEHVYATNEKAYVSDVSGRTVSVVNLSTLSLETTFSFSDGFRPRDIVYNAQNDKIYISSNLTSDFARIRVVDAANYNNYYDLENILPEKRSQDMEISPDGTYIFIAELQTLNVVVLNTATETVVKTLVGDYVWTSDGVTTEEAYFLVTNGGGIYKADYGSLSFSRELYLDRILVSADATAEGELLYVVSPTDSTLQIIETSTLTKISEARVEGVLNGVTVSVSNY